MKPNGREREIFRQVLQMARAEDVGTGDLTSQLLPAKSQVRGRFIARQEMVLAGGVFLSQVAEAYGDGIHTATEVADGQKVSPGTVLARWSGPARQILPAERVALNFLQRLSGIATLTRQYVEAVEGTGAKICDTRKTTPGWRLLEKYAVRAGGGCNHRMGLYDAVLIKDNHLASAARAGADDPVLAMRERIESIRDHLPPGGFVEMEVDTLEQLTTALRLKLDIILLDNMSVEQLSRAVQMRNRQAGAGQGPALEASGGITLETVGQVARTGVERIAVGAVTHSALSIDIGLDDEMEA
ncbi:MAG: carboxylating nicotinate-nucleotide diphosphorylase [Phycisphaerae bacterium]